MTVKAGVDAPLGSTTRLARDESVSCAEATTLKVCASRTVTRTTRVPFGAPSGNRSRMPSATRSTGGGACAAEMMSAEDAINTSQRI